MAHRQRLYLAKLLYEVTIRTLGGHFWLRPDPACRAIIDGVFGRALALYKDVRLHAYDAQSNHLHYLCSATAAPDQLALFIDYVHGNIARQLNDLRDREGTFWGRRGSVIAVLDGAAQIERLRYILAQGPKSNLVASPRAWPGACSTRALLGDMTIPAVYRSLDARRRNARRPNPRPEAELAHDVAITLAPLPVWADLTPASLRAKHAALVAELEAAHAGAAVLGAAHLIAEDPDATPATKLERSPAPACHAFCARVRDRFLAAYATCAPPSACASSPPPTATRSPPRSRRSTRRGRWFAPAGTSPPPTTSPPPGSATSKTPTSPWPRPDRRPLAPALTRHSSRPHRALPGPPGVTPGRSGGGAFGG